MRKRGIDERLVDVAYRRRNFAVGEELGPVGETLSASTDDDELQMLAARR